MYATRANGLHVIEGKVDTLISVFVKPPGKAS